MSVAGSRGAIVTGANERVGAMVANIDINLTVETGCYEN